MILFNLILIKILLLVYGLYLNFGKFTKKKVKLMIADDLAIVLIYTIQLIFYRDSLNNWSLVCFTGIGMFALVEIFILKFKNWEIK